MIEEIPKITVDEIPDFCVNLNIGIKAVNLKNLKNEDSLCIQFDNGDVYPINETIRDFIESFVNCEIVLTQNASINKRFILNNVGFIIDKYKNLACGNGK